MLEIILLNTNILLLKFIFYLKPLVRVQYKLATVKILIKNITKSELIYF